MYKNNSLQHWLLTAFIMIGLMASSTAAFSVKPAPEPSLATDLEALVTQGEAVDAQITAIDITGGSSCTELGIASTSLADWLTATNAVYAGMNTEFSVDTASLDSLDELASLTISMANNLKLMSFDITSISLVTELAELDTMLVAMLSLSTDIGDMANRIGEMADRILIMADNIGLMADRILITQQLQSSNVIAVQNAMLVSQQNAVAISNSISTLVYNPELAALLSQANVLSVSMDWTSLNTLNMGVELARLQSQAAIYLAQLNILYLQVMNDSAFASQYTNGDTLTMAGDLTSVHRALALSLEDFAVRVNSLAPYTATPILSNATDSMLALSRDIGTMSNRIMEMVDRIVVMADNIGEMSLKIVDTQNLQQSNVEYTQASLLTATNVTVGVIAANDL